ncbi:MAG: hypothetical protein ABIT01_12755 [Thermoanaerobaculia bacterium]
MIHRAPSRVSCFARFAGLALLGSSLASSPASAQPYNWTHWGGKSTGRGTVDGAGGAAQLSGPTGIALAADGSLFVADPGNFTIRRITPDGIVTTFAGVENRTGSLDGFRTAARLGDVQGVAFDPAGNLLVADGANYTVRRISPSGAVVTLAGLALFAGTTDGTGSDARFGTLNGIVVDSAGNAFVTDGGHTIRKITPAGVVTTVAGRGNAPGAADGPAAEARFNNPVGIALDAEGSLLIADRGNYTIRRVSSAGQVTTVAGLAGSSGRVNAGGSGARFGAPVAIAVRTDGSLLVGDGNVLRAISAVSTTANVSAFAGEGGTGYLDGPSASAQFDSVSGLAVGPGIIYAADRGNHMIRRITADGIVSRLAGSPPTTGSADTPFGEAQFNQPAGIVADAAGITFVCESRNNTIRKITAIGAVSTFAGVAGATGSIDGTGAGARFSGPQAIAMDAAGVLYVADTNNNLIRRVSTAGEVSTIAGKGTRGFLDGPALNANFDFPTGIAVDANGTIYIADTNNHTIRKLSGGLVTTFAGKSGVAGKVDAPGADARFAFPAGLATDAAGNVYVADTSNSAIRRITPSGIVTTMASPTGPAADESGNPAVLVAPAGVAIDRNGNLFVADPGVSMIFKISSGRITPIGGDATVFASADGVGSAARFARPAGIAVDGLGNVYVADSANQGIRRGARALPDVATIDSATGRVGDRRQLGTSAPNATSWTWRVIRRPVGSSASISDRAAKSPTFTPDVADLFVFELSANNGAGLQSTSTVSLLATAVPLAVSTRTVPIVLDVATATAHYATELALTNNAATRVDVSLLYTAALGTAQGSGTVAESLAPGEQKKIADALEYLRAKGLAIPEPRDVAQQGGTLLVTFTSTASLDPRLVSATARTAALTASPQPQGRAGLAYAALLTDENASATATIFGLRASATDRTNVAVFNTSSEPVTLKVTMFSGTGDGRSAVIRAGETLPPHGWRQYASGELLDGNGFTQGWVTIEKKTASGSFSAYGVINDNATNDGSFVPPASGTIGTQTLTVPVLVETSAFRSELTLANRSASPIVLTLRYTESSSPALGVGGETTITLQPYEQRIIPESIDYLRTHTVPIGAKDEGTYAGALVITFAGTSIDNIFAGARTASLSAAGGQFGLFTPCVYAGQEAITEAYLYGLRSDDENRTNVAVLSAGGSEEGPILLELQAYDGEAGGISRGAPLLVSLTAGQWAQPTNFFKNAGVTNGWVKVTRMSGTAPWIAYAVVNDGANPGERTGDGAYVPMVK